MSLRDAAMRHGFFLVFDLSASVEKKPCWKRISFFSPYVLRCLTGKVATIRENPPPGWLCRNISIHACGCFFQGMIHAADSSQRRYVGQLPASWKGMQKCRNRKSVLESVHHEPQWDFNGKQRSRSEAFFDVISRRKKKYWPDENLITFLLLDLRIKKKKKSENVSWLGVGY